MKTMIDNSAYDTKTLTFDNESVIITDPCYLIPPNRNGDWDESEYGEKMHNLGYTKYITVRNCIGDGEWKVKNQKDGKIIGEIWADSGKTGLYLIDEILKAYPNFFDRKSAKSFVVLIGFTGSITFRFREFTDSLDGHVWREHVLIVECDGKTCDGTEIKFSVDFNDDLDMGDEEEDE